MSIYNLYKFTIFNVRFLIFISLYIFIYIFNIISV